MQVYISHAIADRDLALRLIAELRRSGFNVWSPEDHIYPGDNWAKETGKALEFSELMVVIFSARANDSSMLRQDVQFALTSGGYRGRVIPVLLGFKSPATSDDLPWVLLHMNPIYLAAPSDSLEPVVRRVQEVAGAECNAS